MGQGRNILAEGSGKDIKMTAEELKAKDVTSGVLEKGGGQGAFGKKQRATFIEKIVGPGKGKYGHDVKPGGNGNGDDDAAKKAARVAAIKKANLSNKKYNVGTSTAPDLSGANPASGIISGGIWGGGGGGGYTYGEEEGGSLLSSIPSIVWIILAIGGGLFLFMSSGKGKGKGKVSLPKSFKIKSGKIK